MATARGNVKPDKVDNTNPIAYVLEIIGSLIFIVLLIYVTSSFSAYTSNSGMFALAAGGFWLPLLFGGAAVSSLLLFVASFTNLMRSRPRAYKYPMCLSVMAGFSWIALAAGSGGLTFVAVIGFVVSMIGSAIGMINVPME